MNRRKKLVFISHDTSLSGAPVLLLNLLDLIKKNNTCGFIIVASRGGMLENRFRATGKTIIIKPVDYLKGNVFRNMWQIFRAKLRLLQAIACCQQADIIFSNTITNGRLLKLVAFVRAPVISYIHELKMATDFFELFKASSLTAAHTSLFLYPSEAVSQFLTARFGIGEQKKQYLPYFFPEQPEFSKAQKEAARLAFAVKYGMDPKDLWVVNMGTVTPRKGVHDFLEVATIIKSWQKKISFIWIGGYENEEIKLQVETALKKMQDPAILFTGALPHQSTNLLPFDVFFLSSREDPYPLVVVEAAYLAIPAICFDGSGGIPEFIENDAGWLVPDFSARKAADCIIDINNNRNAIAERGRKARLKAIDRHSDETLIIDKFTRAINSNIN